VKQRLHANLAPIDILTRLELEEIMDKQFSSQTRERFRGIDSARLPPITALGTGGTINLGAIQTSDGVAGPEQGDVWLLRRANVASSSIADTALYVLYRGSTPSDTGQYTNRQLLNGMAFQPAVNNPTPSQPAVPASTTPVANENTYPVNVAISGGTITAVTVNGVQVGTGDGTYLVPSGGTIAVTYSVAPTWVWSNANGASSAAQLGQHVGIEYDAPNKGCLFQPGEQLYAQVFNSIAGNTYLLTGEFIRCPAEMKGKLLS
jgi:hypothetical protein